MPAKRSSRTRKKNKRVLEQINHHAAGADLGSEEVYISVGEHASKEPVRRFGTTTAQLRASAEWMVACGVDTVAMEATGVYWVAAYEIYQEYGLHPVLVSAHAIRSVNGMKKSDYLDCQWLQLLHTFGILQPSVRAEGAMIELRAYMRHRETLVHGCAEQIQRIQKALTLMNVRLDQAVDDVMGVTGQRILRAIVEQGERDPYVLARMRDPKCARSEEQIAEALTGHYRTEQLFVLRQALSLWDTHQELLRTCEAAIGAVLESLAQKADRKHLPKGRGRRVSPRKNEPRIAARELLYERLGVDLTQIAGLSVITILIVISECGIDLSRFPTAGHFCAWLGLAPGCKKSGGRVLSAKTRRTTNRAATALRLAAQSLAGSQTELGAFYRRLRGRIGAEKAITATAAKLARRIYDSLRTGRVYTDRGPDYAEAAHRDRTLTTLDRRARAFGWKLVPIDPNTQSPASTGIEEPMKKPA